MKRPTNKIPRNQRLSGEIQREVYEIISRKLKNPLVTEMFSVTNVDVSKDLSHANVFISVYSTDKEKSGRTFLAIKEDAKRIRYELAKTSRARTVPELHFILDGSMEYGDKMDKLFLEIAKGEKG
ncbi:MAG: 30S ribosome-binding factor RbfA [Clostridia bacterium]|nr:30S ribosome-binding factor RbfA [Clostridia bacterium]